METKGNRERQPPSLLIEYGLLNDQKHYLYNVLENRWDKTTIPILSDQISVPCNYGWVVLLNLITRTCSLWNPESSEMIQLPQWPKPYIHKKCVLSRPPTEPGCYVLFLSVCVSQSEQAFCQIGDDEFVEMSSQDKDDVGFVQALISFRGDIYALVSDMRLMKITFVDRTIEFSPILKSGHPWRISPSLQAWSTLETYYFVNVDDDEMLLVCKMSPAYYLDQFSDFKIFRMDINEQECVELLDIGERAIFVAHVGDAFCCSSIGIKPNSIYYYLIGRNVCIYNLDKRGTISLPPCLTAHRILSKASWTEHSFQ